MPGPVLDTGHHQLPHYWVQGIISSLITGHRASSAPSLPGTGHHQLPHYRVQGIISSLAKGEEARSTPYSLLPELLEASGVTLPMQACPCAAQ